VNEGSRGKRKKRLLMTNENKTCVDPSYFAERITSVVFITFLIKMVENVMMMVGVARTGQINLFFELF
jgi:hypothetical protein